MVKSLGYATTVDVVQQQQYNTTYLQGIKRKHDLVDEKDAPYATKPSNIAYISSKQQLRDTARKRIEASVICSLGAAPRKLAEVSVPPQAVLPRPGPSQNPLLSLHHPRYGLPQTLVKNLASLGINSIYPWQSSCLLGRGLLVGEKNLVYTAPTGGGKSLVADILMLKRLIEDPSKKAILVLPYVALVQEKLNFLRKAVDGVRKSTVGQSQSNSQIPKWRKNHDTSVRVAGFYGGSKARATWVDVDIAICTIEKVRNCRLIRNYIFADSGRQTN